MLLATETGEGVDRPPRAGRAAESKLNGTKEEPALSPQPQG